MPWKTVSLTLSQGHEASRVQPGCSEKKAVWRGRMWLGTGSECESSKSKTGRDGTAREVIQVVRATK